MPDYANCPKCGAASAGREVCPACGLIFAKYRKPAPAPPRSAGKPPVRSYGQALAVNLLPLVGMLVFGWSAAPALFLLWLDTLLCNLRIVGPALAAFWKLTHVELEGRKVDSTRTFRIFGTAVLCLALSAPAVMIGIVVIGLTARDYPGGPLAAAFGARGLWLLVVIEIFFRGYPMLSRASDALDAAEPSLAFGAKLLNEFMNLLHRSATLMILAFMAVPLGYWGLVIFLALAAAFISYVDLHQDWLGHLERKAKQAGEERRARKLEEKSREKDS